MSRPTVLPDWATGPNFSTGPVAGNPNKVQPSGGQVVEGFDPGATLAAENLNFLINNQAAWIDYLDSINTGTAFLFRDDFIGSSVDTGLWTNNGSVNTTSYYTNAQFFGAANISGSGLGVSQSLVTRYFNMSATKQFTFDTMVSLNNPAAWSAGTLSQIILGLVDPTAGAGTYGMYFTSTGGAGAYQNWHAQTNIIGGAFHDLATGVTTLNNTATRLTIIGVSGTLTFYINGTSVGTLSQITGTDTQIALYATGGAQMFVDYVKVWIDR